MRNLRNEESGELMRLANRLYRNSNPLTVDGMTYFASIKSELLARLWSVDNYLCGGFCMGYPCKDSHMNLDQIADEVKRKVCHENY